MGTVPPMAWMGVKRGRKFGELFESWGRIGEWMRDDLERLGGDISIENRFEIYLECIWKSIENLSKIYRKSIEHLCIWVVSEWYLRGIWGVSGVYLGCVWDVSEVYLGWYLRGIWRVSEVYPRFIWFENLSKIYRKSIENLSKSIENLSKIYVF